MDLGAGDWWERGPEVAGVFGEKSERVAGFFLERYTRGRVLAQKCGSDKYRGVKDRVNVKCFPKI